LPKDYLVSILILG